MLRRATKAVQIGRFRMKKLAVMERATGSGFRLLGGPFLLAILPLSLLASTTIAKVKGVAKGSGAPHAIICSAGIEVVANLKQGPFPAEDALEPAMGAGVAWLGKGGGIAAAAASGLTVWHLAHRATFDNPKVLPYRRMGLTWHRRVSPDALIEQQGAVGVALFVAGAHGSSPRLIMDWYSRKVLTLLRAYEIRLTGTRNTGVQVVGPGGGSWFATIPYTTQPFSPVHLWRSKSGTSIPARFPPLWQAHNWLFCDTSGRELGWVSSGHYVWLARLTASGSQLPAPSPVRIISSGLRRCALAPDGKHLLLLASREPYQPSDVKAILAPRSGSGVEKVSWIAGTGGDSDSGIPIAGPAFSPNGKLAAIGLLSPHATPGGVAGADVYIVSVRKFHILYKVEIPGIIPIALSFSPDGSRLAVESQQSIVVLHIFAHRPSTVDRYWRHLPAAIPRSITIPPSPVPRSILEKPSLPDAKPDAAGNIPPGERPETRARKGDIRQSGGGAWK